MYKELSPKEWHDALDPHAGEKLASGLLTMYQGIATAGCKMSSFGYNSMITETTFLDYNGQALEPSNKLLESPPRTLIESLKANADLASKVFA